MSDTRATLTRRRALRGAGIVMATLSAITIPIDGVSAAIMEKEKLMSDTKKPARPTVALFHGLEH
jgi:hypothetical protein